jgi:branched-subunit amino acid transport protein AzlD
MLIILSIVVAVAALIILPFWHLLGVGIFAALLFWMFHIHPLPVIALYLVAYCIRGVLVFLGLAGLFAWATREK